MYANLNNQYTYIASATTTQVATGPCVLSSITINTTAAGTIKIIDGTSGSTANVATLAASIGEQTLFFNCVMKAGIRIITAGASDITVSWKSF